MVEIYGLYDPDSGELRYVGKANNALQRLKSHITDSRRSKRPVCQWVKSIVQARKYPRLEILETVNDDEWKEAEIRLIAHYRKTCDLLNLADGGDMPSQTKEQRANAARAARKAADSDPLWANMWRAKRDAMRLLTQFRKSKSWFNYYHLRLILKCQAAQSPHIWGSPDMIDGSR